MQAKSLTIKELMALTHWRIVLWMCAAALVIVLGVTASSDASPELERVEESVEAEAPPAPPAPAEPEDVEPVESVTMAIQLEEGGSIDVDTSLGDVTIDTWDGDAVLVILEKSRRLPTDTRSSGRVQPIDIQVTRRGKDIRIDTMGATSKAIRDLDISFRIMVPQDQGIRSTFVNDGYSISKLTSVIMRALHKEAVKWIVR